MVLCGSAVPFSSVDDLPRLSLPSHVHVVFHNRCCHGKAVAGTDEPNSWSDGQKLRSDAQNGQLRRASIFPRVFGLNCLPRGITATREISHGTRLCNCVQLNVQANLSPKFGGLKGSGFSTADILAVAV